LFSGAAYGAFGESYASTGTPNNQFAGLTGDISSGTEQVSLTRRYHPGQGRWISPDPAGAGGNLYAYVSNNPLNFTDPSGLFSSDCVGCESDFYAQQLGAWNQSIDFRFNSWVDWNSQHTLDDQGNSLYSQLPGKSNPVQQALNDYADDIDLSSAPNGIEGYTPDNHSSPQQHCSAILDSSMLPLMPGRERG
jgi:RHS repeat-associated protein